MARIASREGWPHFPVAVICPPVSLAQANARRLRGRAGEVGAGADEGSLMDAITAIIGIVTGVIVPAVGLLFKRLSSLGDAIEAEKDQRQRLELMIAREYVSQISLEKIMAPIQKDVNNLERMIERIASRLSVPAVADD